MKRKLLLVGVLVAATLAVLRSGSAAEGFVSMSGNQLHWLCSSDSGTERAGVCFGYALAISDIAAQESPPSTICLPSKVTQKQVMDVVSLYLKQHPEERHHSAVSVAVDALGQAFPCKK